MSSDRMRSFLLELAAACDRADEIERFNPSLPIGRAGIPILSIVLTGGDRRGREMSFSQAAKWCRDLSLEIE